MVTPPAGPMPATATASGPMLGAPAGLAGAVSGLPPQSVLMLAGSSPAPTGCCPPSAAGCAASSRRLRDADLLWVGSLSSDDDDDEVLAPRTPLAVAHGPDSGAVRVSNIVGSPRAGGGTVEERMEPLAAMSCSVAVNDEVEGNAMKTCASPVVVEDDEGWVQVGRGGRPGREPTPLLRGEGLECTLAFKRWARGRCFRCLERDHQVSTCRGPFRCIRCRRPGHRERFCRVRFPATMGEEVVTCVRSPVASAHCQRSHSPSAQPRRPSSPRSWVEVVDHSAVAPRPSPTSCEQFKINATLDSLFQSQVALMRMELLQLVDVRVEETSRPLREEVAALKLLLACAGVSVEPTEACPSVGLGLAKAQASVALDSSEQKSSVVEEEHLHGCFSPHGPSSLPNESAASEREGMDKIAAQSLDLELSDVADTPVSLSHESGEQVVAKSVVLTPVPASSPPQSEPCQSPQPVVLADSKCEDIDEFLASVLQITEELHELRGDSLVVLPSALCSFETMEVATTPSPPQSESCQSLASLDHGAVLVPSSDALFAKELCGLLASLEAASPGYGKEIACVLAGKASEDMIKKVEKSLRKVSIRRIRRRAITREV